METLKVLVSTGPSSTYVLLALLIAKDKGRREIEEASFIYLKALFVGHFSSDYLAIKLFAGDIAAFLSH